MDSHSWSNRKKQAAIISDNSEKLPQKLAQGGCLCRRGGRRLPPATTTHFYVIGKAYIEPQFCSHIENILLQRNFIID